MFDRLYGLLKTPLLLLSSEVVTVTPRCRQST